MKSPPQIHTARLLLRRWHDADREDFHTLNSDRQVMSTIGPTMSRSESDAFMNRIEERFDQHGFGLWCVDLDGQAIGFTGLTIPWFRQGIEVGWRLRREYWGEGYAPEAAEACLGDGFGNLALDEIISFTARTNHRSRRVMQKLGLVHYPGEDFDHPSVPAGNPLREHVLYRITVARYRARRDDDGDAAARPQSEPAG